MLGCDRLVVFVASGFLKDIANHSALTLYARLILSGPCVFILSVVVIK